MISLEQVEAGLRNNVYVDSEDWNDVLFTGQRIRGMKDPQLGPSIELGEIPIDQKI